MPTSRVLIQRCKKMLTYTQMQQAINNLNTLISHYNSPASVFTFNKEQITKNWFFKSKQENIKQLESYFMQMIQQLNLE